MATYEVEIRINSSVVVLIEADDLKDATKQADEMCKQLDFGKNVPEIDIAYPHTIQPTWGGEFPRLRGLTKRSSE